MMHVIRIKGVFRFRQDANCDDGDACTFGTTCGAGGACSGGSVVDCEMVMHAPLIPVILRWDVCSKMPTSLCATTGMTARWVIFATRDLQPGSFSVCECLTDSDCPNDENFVMDPPSACGGNHWCSQYLSGESGYGGHMLGCAGYPMRGNTCQPETGSACSFLQRMVKPAMTERLYRGDGC